MHVNEVYTAVYSVLNVSINCDLYDYIVLTAYYDIILFCCDYI